MTVDKLAILRDERDLLWLAIGGVQRRGNDRFYDVHLLARDEPGQSPEPFVTTEGHREPAEGLGQLIHNLGEAVLGHVSALRHDPIADGLSLELKASGEGQDLRFEVVLWLDLTRMSRALKARGTRGRHQVGMRMFTDRERLEDFRAALFDLAFSAADE